VRIVKLPEVAVSRSPQTSVLDRTSPGAAVTRAELARLQHDLDGPLAVFDGFLGELNEAVEELAQLPAPIDAQTLSRLLEDDFRPCLSCLVTALDRLRATVGELDRDDVDHVAA